MKSLAVTLLLCLSILGLRAQTISSPEEFKSRFYDEVFDKKYDGALAILDEWEKAFPTDGELWPARFNYHINKSRQEVMWLSTDTLPQGEAMMLANEDGSLAGSLQPLVQWDDDEFQKAIEAIENGIKERPDRLDYRLGEMTAYRYRDMTDKAVDLLIETAEYDVANTPKWLWTDDSIADQTVAQAIVDVASELFYSETEDEAFERLVAEASRLYPDNFMIINLMGVDRLLNKDYSKALEYLEKALSLNPGDDIVMCNIAYTYLQKGDKAKARELYQQLIDSPQTSDDIRADATSRLATLSD
ncbi:MAG: tetratricopeptide repeat protein [Muribaculaceae bacterium]|nr:tetratricopeptide repeat protein [Muribaculaceae bacterium]